MRESRDTTPIWPAKQLEWTAEPVQGGRPCDVIACPSCQDSLDFGAWRGIMYCYSSRWYCV